MRKIYSSLISVLLSASAFAQSNISDPIDLRIEKEIIPPYLSIVEGSVKFIDDNGNKEINANEQSYIFFKIKNTGKGDAIDCVAKITATGTTNGLSYKSQELPVIKSGAEKEISFPITSSMYTVTGDVEFTVQVEEPNDFGTSPAKISVSTRKFEAPMIEVVSYKVLSNEGKLMKKKPFKLQLLLQNTDYGLAHDVTLQFDVPDNMFLQEGETYYQFTELQPNEKKQIILEFQTNSKIQDAINLSFKLGESYGRYAKDADIPLAFGQATGGDVYTTKYKSTAERKKIERGSLTSVIDENIPMSDKVNDNTFVLIVANENYDAVSSVPFALNDGQTFKQYCERTLGVPDKNIQYVTNATGNKLKNEIATLSDLIKLKHGDAKVIFYYAGHGVPDSKKGNGNAYLLPTDGVGSDFTTGYKLDELYASLGEYPSQSVTVFLDACFSGGTRIDKETLDPGARGVAISVKQGQPVGRMVVFSAAQEDQTANPDEAEQHGMFTYYLLKKIQETSGDVTLDELTNYVIENVGLESVRNHHKQVPCVTSSSEVGKEWKTWKLK